MLVALHYFFLLAHDLLLALVLLRLDGLALPLLLLLEEGGHVMADHLALVEVLNHLEADRWDLAQPAPRLLVVAHSAHAVQFLQDALLEEVIL